MKHTPGPWKVETWEYSGSTSRIMIVTDTDAIAEALQLWRPDNHNGELRTKSPSMAETVGNARLIAKAPEMFEALKFVVPIFMTWAANLDNGDYKTETYRHIARIKGLVVELEGEK